MANSQRNRPAGTKRKVKRRPPDRRQKSGCEIRVSVPVSGRIRKRVSSKYLNGTNGTAYRRNAKLSARQRTRMAAVLDSIGHPIRLTLVQLLLIEPSDYSRLSRLTGCKAGPLYHHLNKLKLANVVAASTGRNVYQLTTMGQMLGLITCALPKVILSP